MVENNFQMYLIMWVMYLCSDDRDNMEVCPYKTVFFLSWWKNTLQQCQVILLIYDSCQMILRAILRAKRRIWWFYCFLWEGDRLKQYVLSGFNFLWCATLFWKNTNSTSDQKFAEVYINLTKLLWCIEDTICCTWVFRVYGADLQNSEINAFLYS